MTNRIEPFEVTTPAGTLKSAYLQTPLSFNRGRVERIEVFIPPGSSGLMGFRIAHSGQSVIPYTGDRWFVFEDDRLDWPVSNYPVGGAWELWSYNLDIYEHTIYLWFHVNDLGSVIAPVVAPLEVFPIGSAEDFETSDTQVE